LFEDVIDLDGTKPRIEAMQTLGVPYPEGFADKANEDLMKQATAITEDLKKGGIEIGSDREIIALIAYLQRLGTDIKQKTPAQVVVTNP